MTMIRSELVDLLSTQLWQMSLVIVLIGGNDQLGGTGVLEFRRDYEQLVDHLAVNRNVVIAIQPPTSPASSRVSGWASLSP